MHESLETAKHTTRLAASGFSDDELMRRTAALAFYSAQSFALLRTLLLSGLSLLHSGLDQRLIDTLTGMLDWRAVEAVKSVMDHAKKRPYGGNIAGLIGLAVTLMGRSALFAQLPRTLNRVCGVRARPGGPVGARLRSYVQSLAVLVGIAFLPVVSFLLSRSIKLLVSGGYICVADH